MLLKELDSKDHVVAELERLAIAATGDRKKALDRELRIMRAGIKGERDSAYLIDFDFKAYTGTVVIHDLRIEVNGRVAQIDHMLIDRMLNCFVLETKHFHAGFKITDDGEFLRWSDYKKAYEGMASPLAQNERHVAVLRDAFKAIEMPTRLGIRLMPTFVDYVLVSADARIDRPKVFDTSRVIKADSLKAALDKRIDKISPLGALGSLAKTIGADTLLEIGNKLVAMHRPSPIDVVARYGGPIVVKTPTGPISGSGPLTVSIPRVNAPMAATPTQKAPAKVASGLLAREDDGPPRCRGCQGLRLTIHYGKSYYFKCADCDANTPARVSCGQAQHNERLRKEGRNFFRECSDCGTSVLYFMNPT